MFVKWSRIFCIFSVSLSSTDCSKVVQTLIHIVLIKINASKYQKTKTDAILSKSDMME